MVNGKISIFKKPNGEVHFPVTSADAVFMGDGHTTVSTELFNKASKSETKSIQQQVNNLVLGAVGDGNNAEVIQARGDYSTLNDRITNINHKADDSLVANSNLAFYVDESTYTLMERKAYNHELKIWESNKSRATSIRPIQMSRGDAITLKNFDNHSVTYYCFVDGVIAKAPSWATEKMTLSMDGDYYVLVKKNDGTQISDSELLEINNLIICENNNSLTIKNEKIENRIEEIGNNIGYLYKNALGYLKNVTLEQKVYANGGFTKSTTRCVTKDPLKVKLGQVIKLEDYSKFVWSIVAFDSNGNYLTSSGWRSEDSAVTSTYADAGYVHIQIAYSDFREFDEEELTTISRQLVITNFYEDEGNTLENDIFALKNGLINTKEIIKESGIAIDSGKYYQRVLSDWARETEYAVFLQTDDLEGKYCSLICLREGVLSNRNMYKSVATYFGDGLYGVAYKTSNDETTTNFEVFVDFRASAESITLKDIVLKEFSFGISNSNTSAGSGELVLYVSPEGNDENNGLSQSAPLLNINTAIKLGATTILCKRGDYYNQTPISSTGNESRGKKIKIIPYENSSFSNSAPLRPLINLINGNKIDGLVNSNDLLTKKLEPNEHIKDVFVDKTKEPIDTANTRSVGYFSTIWQLHEDNTLDAKLKPVLTLSECKAEKGTFYHNGTDIYINPFNTEYKSFVLPNKSTQITLNDFSELVLEDICCQFSYNNNFVLKNNMNMLVRNCHSRYTMLGDGIVVDNSNANLYNCTSFKSRNDGFNIHGYGVSNFYNCSGYYNYDDGISHHDGCTGVIDGGEWHHNGKGGISSPTHGAYNDIYNVECHNNGYGIYAVSSEGKRNCKGRVFNSVLYDNTKADIILQLADVKIYNTKYKTKGVSANSNLIEL